MVSYANAISKPICVDFGKYSQDVPLCTPASHFLRLLDISFDLEMELMESSEMGASTVAGTRLTELNPVEIYMR